MPKTKKIFNSVRKAADVLNTASMVTKDITMIGNSYDRRVQAKESGELERIKREIDLYDRKSRILIWCCLIVWILLVITTIILCAIGNDVVLRVLHI